MKGGVGDIIISLLKFDKDSSLNNEWNLATEEACRSLRGFCIHDDTRRDMSCAYDNGKFFLASDSMNELMKLCKDFKNQTQLAIAALSAARQLILTEESVKLASQYGAMTLPYEIFAWEQSPLSLVRSVTALMRNLCADDERKSKLVNDGTLLSMLKALSTEEYATDYSFVEHALACIAAMTLRCPGNSSKIMEFGTAELIVKSMRRHKDKAALLRQGCLAVRNIAARCPEYRGNLLDAGFEPVLRDAGRFQDAVDEAYGN